LLKKVCGAIVLMAAGKKNANASLLSARIVVEIYHMVELAL
jgi:hypothetical protein